MFEISELTEIVWQSCDPNFVQILYRTREGSHKDDDIKKIKSLANTGNSHWPNGFVKVCLISHPANVKNLTKWKNYEQN